jgi:hypothetical protein
MREDYPVVCGEARCGHPETGYTAPEALTNSERKYPVKD